MITGLSEDLEMSFNNVLMQAKDELFEYGEGLRDRQGEPIEKEQLSESELIENEKVLIDGLESVAEIESYRENLPNYLDKKGKAFAEVELYLNQILPKIDAKEREEYERQIEERDSFFRLVDGLAEAEVKEAETNAALRTTEEFLESREPAESQAIEEIGKVVGEPAESEIRGLEAITEEPEESFLELEEAKAPKRKAEQEQLFKIAPKKAERITPPEKIDTSKLPLWEAQEAEKRAAAEKAQPTIRDIRKISRFGEGIWERGDGRREEAETNNL